MLKSEIRKRALKDRLAINADNYKSLNEGLVSQFIKLDFSSVKTIHIFLPIVEKKEPDTFLLIEWLSENHPDIKIIVPKADFETALITSYEYSGTGDLQKNLYNIPEPQSGVLYNGTIDAVLVPLLAFDKQGFRVGYGKGFYDRFLGHTNAKKIGLSLLPAMDKIDDVNEHDIRLDLCLTPTATINFKL